MCTLSAVIMCHCDRKGLGCSLAQRSSLGTPEIPRSGCPVDRLWCPFAPVESGLQH